MIESGAAIKEGTQLFSYLAEIASQVEYAIDILSACCNFKFSEEESD